MTRVNDRSLASRLPRLGERHTQRKKKPYKIVLEHVTQEKKKLQSIISYNANAPPGYTFVPTGAPELTARCKELCRKRGLDVHVVSVAPKNRAHNNPEKIAHHVHRIGHHFPNDIVDLACEWEGYTIHHGQFRKNKDTVDTSRLAKSLQSHSSKETSEQVRLAIRDLFPKIPKKDLDNIIKHAFRNGTSRVGNAAELSLPRRVQLAVVAHIRHEYTNYDKLLKQNTYHEARSRVEPTTLDRLMKWRGENDSGKRELEEMFREIIVIDDSEDEDDGTTSDDQTEERHESVEITSRPLRHQDIRWDEPDNVEWVPHPQSRRHRGTYLIRVPGRMRLPYPPPPTLSTRPRAYEPPPRLIPTRPERVYVSEAAPPPRGVYAAPQSERFIYESPQHPTRPMHPYVDDIPRQLARSRPDDAYERSHRPIPPPVRALQVSEPHLEQRRQPPSRFYVEDSHIQDHASRRAPELTHREPIPTSSQPTQPTTRQSPPRQVRDEDVALPSIEAASPQNVPFSSDPAKDQYARINRHEPPRDRVEPYDPRQAIPEARGPRQQASTAAQGRPNLLVKRKSWHDAYTDEVHDPSYKRVRPDYPGAHQSAQLVESSRRRTPPKVVDLTYPSLNRPKSPRGQDRLPVAHDISRPIPHYVESPGRGALAVEAPRRLAFPPESSILSHSYRRRESPRVVERSVYSSHPHPHHPSERPAFESQPSHREIYGMERRSPPGYVELQSHPNPAARAVRAPEEARIRTVNTTNRTHLMDFPRDRPRPVDVRPRYHEPPVHRPQHYYAQS